MSSADKVAEVNTLHRAYVVTGSAAGTLVVIYSSKIVLNLNCALGAALFTLSAGDTAVKTNLSYLSALVVT